MEDEEFEKISQLQHENAKLLDELKLLRKHAISIEENYNSLFSASSVRENHIKWFVATFNNNNMSTNAKPARLNKPLAACTVALLGYNQKAKIFCSLKEQISRVRESLKDKDKIIDMLEIENEKSLELNKKLSSDLSDVKKKLAEEQKISNLNKEEFLATLAKVKEESDELRRELSRKGAEITLRDSTLSDLLQKYKELEDEKLELLASRDNLLQCLKEEQDKKRETAEGIMIDNCDHNMNNESMYCIGRSERPSQQGQEQTPTLKEEILQVEMEEQALLIGRLKSSLLRKEEENVVITSLIGKLRMKLRSAGLLGKWSAGEEANLSLSSSLVGDIHSLLLDIISCWPERQPEESKESKEVLPVTVALEDGVQSGRPRSLSTIESVSIAIQTDPAETHYPALPLKEPPTTYQSTESNSGLNFNEVQNVLLPYVEENDVSSRSPLLFSNHRNTSLDMDVFRFYRKLSVLPEEEPDELTGQKPFKNRFIVRSVELETQSGNDLSAVEETNFRTNGNDSKDLNLKNKLSTGHDIMFVAHEYQIGRTERFDAEHPRNDIIDPLNAFDRRETFSIERGPGLLGVSKRGGAMSTCSTCRPLTLPCDESYKKLHADRVGKVRFDLSGVCPKEQKNLSTRPVSQRLKTQNAVVVSRFRVEAVDEADFRKSLAFSEPSPPWKRLPDDQRDHLESERRPTFESQVPPCKRPKPSMDPRRGTSSPEGNEGNDYDDVEEKERMDRCFHAINRCLAGREFGKESDQFRVARQQRDCANASYENEGFLHTSDGSHLMEKSIVRDLCEINPDDDKTRNSHHRPDFGPADAFNDCETRHPGPRMNCPTRLSKSPTFLKNLANFELLTSIVVTNLVNNVNVNRGKLSNAKCEENFEKKAKTERETVPNCLDANILDLRPISESKESSLDGSSDSETVTYATVKSHLLPSSDCDSETYVTVSSDKSSFVDKKFLDISENSSSPYNTPSEVNSGDFYTPPDHYSPVGTLVRNGNNSFSVERGLSEIGEQFTVEKKANDAKGEPPSRLVGHHLNHGMSFDGPKLEFYEPNDSADESETFLLSEEGLCSEKLADDKDSKEPEPHSQNSLITGNHGDGYHEDCSQAQSERSRVAANEAS